MFFFFLENFNTTRATTKGNQAASSTEQTKIESQAENKESENKNNYSNRNIVRTLSEDTSSDDPLNSITPMAPLGMYGAIGGKDSNAINGCDKTMVNQDGISRCQSKEMSLGTDTNRINQHHLPFSSRSNETSSSSTRFTTQPQQDMVSINAAITSMTAIPHMNAGTNSKKRVAS